MNKTDPAIQTAPAAPEPKIDTGGSRPYLPAEWQDAPQSQIALTDGKRAVSPYVGPSIQEEEIIEARTRDLTPSRLRFLPLLCFLVTFAIYVAWVPRFVLYSSPPTGDQPFYLMDVISLVQDGDLNIRNNYDNWDFDKFYKLAPHPPDFVGMGAPYPLPKQLAVSTARPPIEEYSFHLPGLAVLLVPAWIIGSLFQLWWPATVVFMCLIGALVATNVILLAHEITGRLGIAVAVWLPIAFSNPVMTFSYLLFTELTVGLLAIYVFRRLALGWGANGPWRIALMGLSIAAIPWIAWRCAPLAAMLCAYAAVQWWRFRRATSRGRESVSTASQAAYNSLAIKGAIPAPEMAADRSRRWLSFRRSNSHEQERRYSPSYSRGRGILRLVGILLPLVVSGAGIAWYNMFLFGRPVPDSKVPELGDRIPFHWPWGGLDELKYFVTSTFGLLFDQQFGLLIYAPIYLLAVVGMIAMFRSRQRADRRLLAAMALVLLPYTGLIFAFHFWTGIWGPPARYLTTLMPFMAAPLAMSLLALSGNWLYKLIYGALALPGMIFMWAMMHDARRMWPLDVPVLTWLETEAPLRINLKPVLPYFSPPDEAYLPSNSGWITAASFLIVLFCYFLLRRARPAVAATSASAAALALDRPSFGEPRRLQRTVRLVLPFLSWFAAAALIFGGWLFMNFEYLKPRVTLIEQSRWEINPPLIRPYGIAYLDGAIYVTGFGYQDREGIEGSGMLGVVNLTTGVYQPVPVTSPQGASVTLSHPGDVKVVDGLLYLLNNGPEDQALFVLRPDGQIVKQMALNNKTGIATGMNFGPDRSIYVADMLGGGVVKYGPEGGQVIQSFRGPNGGLNNPSGVVVAPDGTVYTNEGHGPIHQFNQDGSLARKFEPGCEPVHLALNGQWLDVTCNSLGLVSINTASGEMKLSRFDRGSGKPNSPTGLTYGPDGTLYILDGNTLRAFKIQH